MSDERQVTIQDLLGDREEKKEKKKPKKSSPKKKAATEWNGATKDLWVSTFYKMLRIGNPEDAFVAYTILIEKFGVNDWYVITKLEGLVGEDCCPKEMARLLPMLRAMEEKRKDKSLWGHHMAIAIYEVGMAKKWYQTEDGRRLERMRHLYWYDGGTKEDAMRNLQVPSIAHDTHTRYGNGPKADRRLDGHWWNRFNVEKRWKRLVEHLGFEEPLTDKEYEEVREKWVMWHMAPVKRKRRVEENYKPKETDDFQQVVFPTDEDGVFKVQSASDPDLKYDVDMNKGTCSCPSYQNRKKPCKHISWVEEFLKEDE